MPIVPCSARITRCSSAGSCANRPLRRSGYQTAHLQAGLSTVRRGRCSSTSVEIGLVADRVGAARASCTRASAPATRTARRSTAAARDRGRTSGSSLNVSSADAARVVHVLVQHAGDVRRAPARRRAAPASAQPPNASNCMNSRSFGSLRLAVLHAAFLAEVRRLGSAASSAVCRVRHALSIIRRFACPTIASGPRRSTTSTRSCITASRMFTDMGVPLDATGARRARFAPWLARDDAGGHCIARGSSRHDDRRRSSRRRHHASCRGRRARTMSATGSRSSTTSTPTRRIAARPRAARHGGDPRLVPRRRASARSRSTPAATASRSTSDGLRRDAEPDDVFALDWLQGIIRRFWPRCRPAGLDHAADPYTLTTETREHAIHHHRPLH